MSHRHSVAVMVLSAAALIFALPQPADDTPVPSAVMPHLVGGVPGQRVDRDFYVFSWQEFYALNWPAKMGADHPERGVPDTARQIDDLTGPRVWETWKADYELFPEQTHGPATPTPWPSWEVAGKPPCSAGADVRLLPFVAKGESLIPAGVNQAMGGPLVDQNRYYVRYEVRVDQSEYDKIVQKSWFLRKNLHNYPAPPNLLDASTQDAYGAIELKAAWRVIKDDEPDAVKSRYYTIKATLVDPKTGQCSPKPVTMGLVGLHIAHKTGNFAAWVWSTFEQVDNVPKDGTKTCPDSLVGCSFYDGKTSNPALTNWGFSPAGAYRPQPPGTLQQDGKATPVQVVRLNKIPDDAQKLNAEVHDLPGIKGTVWQYYQLVEAQWQSNFDPIKISNDRTAEDLYSRLAGVPTPDAVANTSMESFYQGFKGPKPNPAKNPMGIPAFGTSCLHCHYAAAQYDFSWMLADQPYPATGGAHRGTTKVEMNVKKRQ